MRPTLRCLPFLLSAVLWAQTAALRVLLDREALEGPAPVSLLVLDPPGQPSLSNGLRTLLQRPELAVLQVPVQSLTLGSAAARDLLARLDVAARPQWLLVSQGQVVLGRGATLPTPEALGQELARAGFRDRALELRRYLKIHPASREAQERLIAILRQRAETAAMRLLGLEPASPRDQLQSGDLPGFLQAQDAPPPKVDIPSEHAFTPTQDLEVWSAFTQELDLAFRSGAWRDLDLAFTRDGRPLDGTSPTLQALYRRALPEVEAALRRAPSSEALWDLWIWMDQALGGQDVAALIASLTPPPLAARGDWPPARAMRMLMATARTPQTWRALLAYYEDQWEGSAQMLRRKAPEASPASRPGQATAAALLEQDWNRVLAPLLECCLRCGEANRAEAHLREALDACRWPSLPARAAAVATRCAQPAVARKWAALRPGGGR